ncbi:hypothetical protein V5799_004436 [Amblyomma americanum]|uniref:Secreted protein n=1 Tax=Amblyomma americanum TaxID=6943 RepID=A0AAQ4D646_AMBAM
MPLVVTSSAGDLVVAAVFAACVAFDSCPPSTSAAQSSSPMLTQCQLQLKRLIASARDAGIDNLFTAPEALRPLVSSCPQLLQCCCLPLMRREFLLSKVGEEPLVRTSESKELLIAAMRYHLMPAPLLSHWLREMQTPMHDLLEPYDRLLNTMLTRRSSLLTLPSISLGCSCNYSCINYSCKDNHY